jgi:Dolichol-phosphate mannosyltransferase subunit 3 (DPM3)
MKRAAIYGAALVLLAGLWLGLWAAAAQSKWVGVVSLIPVWAVILFGFGCATKLVWELLTFNNCPNEIAALEKDIAEAKQDLKKRGFK